jgi:hypothetical protein
MYAITRLEEKPGVWRWAVNLTRRGKGYCKSFYDLKSGGSRKALAAAIAWRDRQLAKIQILTRREFRQIKRSDNRSGVPGVLFIRRRNQRRGSWQAKIRVGKSKQVAKTFAVKKFGNRGAFERAVQARAELLELIENQPYLYDPLAKRIAAKRATKAGL